MRGKDDGAREARRERRWKAGWLDKDGAAESIRVWQ